MTKKPAPRTTTPASQDGSEVAARPVAWLEVVASPDRARNGERIPLSDDLTLLGRDVQAGGPSIEDQRLSRIHARIAFDSRAGAYRIGDSQSRNGTFLNGRRVETALLFDGGVIRAGDTLFVYCEREPMRELRQQIARVAQLPSTVLLRGETGTGKELCARALHAQSGRSGPFIAVNCASIPRELVAAELFGHTKHAFSGAGAARKGLFAAADGGLLFLDEIGDCPLPVQTSLLRAIQEKAIRPIGAEREYPIDVRLVAATHADLEAAEQQGTFRRDLLARLSQVTLRVPALRERRAEFPQLIRELTSELGSHTQFSVDALEALLCWEWPSNVRELQSLLHTWLVHGDEKVDKRALKQIRPDMVAALGESQAARLDDAPNDSRARRQQLSELLAVHHGNVSAVAQALGKPRAQIYRWMKAFGLSSDKFRE